MGESESDGASLVECGRGTRHTISEVSSRVANFNNLKLYILCLSALSYVCHRTCNIILKVFLLLYIFIYFYFNLKSLCSRHMPVCTDKQVSGTQSQFIILKIFISFSFILLLQFSQFSLAMGFK